MNTCESEHDAIVKANTRSTPGYAVTGCGLVVCARHSFVRKNGAGDLQKGERHVTSAVFRYIMANHTPSRYCNMDFIALSALSGTQAQRVVITYDIACQWSKNFRARMAEFPESMQLNPSVKIDAAVPSFHINGHGQACRQNFALGHLPGGCRTCGDNIESSWSHMNPLGSSIREMSPAARRETLNDHWNSWNFRKIVGLREFF